MNRALVRTVWKRAGDRCEYCLTPKWALPLPFQIDHIIAENYGGQTAEGNLALACPHCNRFKARTLPESIRHPAKPCACFTPAGIYWEEHFQWEGARIVGRTPIGRASVQVLAMNADDLLLIRLELRKEGMIEVANTAAA